MKPGRGARGGKRKIESSEFERFHMAKEKRQNGTLDRDRNQSREGTGAGGPGLIKNRGFKKKSLLKEKGGIYSGHER